MKVIHRRRDSAWATHAISAIRFEGVAIIAGVLDEAMVQRCRQAVDSAGEAIEAELGPHKLAAARQAGYNELRLMMKYDSYFLTLLAVPELLSIIDATLGPTAVLRFQNAEVTHPRVPGEPAIRQHGFHMNTPRVMPGYLASVDAVFPLTGFSAASDDFLVVPATQQQLPSPDSEYMEWAAVPVECPPGGMIVFDSTMWHREGKNRTGETRVFISQQFTRSFIKPHFDFVRALGEDCIQSLPERTRQLLGWYTRIPTSLEEFYQPPELRLYRDGQG